MADAVSIVLCPGGCLAPALPLLVASEFYTLGVAKEVRDLGANAVVENIPLVIDANLTLDRAPPEDLFPISHIVCAQSM